MGQILVIIIAIVIRIIIIQGRVDNNYSTSSSRKTYSSNYSSSFKRKTLYDDIAKDVKKENPSMSSTEVDEVNFAVQEAAKQVETEKETKLQYETPAVEVSTASPINKMKFMLHTLVYLMYEDDGEFSRKERKLVQTVIKVTSKRLSETDRKDVEGIVDIRPNLNSLFNLVDEYELTPQDVFDTVKELRRTVKSKPEYEKVLRRIEDRATYEL